MIVVSSFMVGNRQSFFPANVRLLQYGPACCQSRDVGLSCCCHMRCVHTSVTTPLLVLCRVDVQGKVLLTGVSADAAATTVVPVKTSAVRRAATDSRRARV